MSPAERDDLLHSAQAAIDREDGVAALALLLPLAEGDDAEAQYRLGQFWFLCLDVLSETECIGWLRRAAAQNHVEALYQLAMCGPGDQPEHVLFLRAAELGHADAQCHVGACLATGDWSGPHDPAAARVWYRKAAEQGHAGARANLGGMLVDGDGGPADWVEGLKWLEAAAAQGELQAIQHLALVFEHGGYGLAPDPERARSLRTRYDDAIARIRSRSDEA